MTVTTNPGMMSPHTAMPPHQDRESRIETGVDQKAILKEIEDLRDQLTEQRGLPNL